MESNQQKMRDALDAALRFIGNLEIEPYSPLDEAASELRQRIMDALAAPARQCDVGSAEEQEVRFKRFCESHWDLNKPGSECAGCPLDERVGTECEFAWAQTPYAEEGAGK